MSTEVDWPATHRAMGEYKAAERRVIDMPDGPDRMRAMASLQALAARNAYVYRTVPDIDPEPLPMARARAPWWRRWLAFWETP